jgi:hypothetical protein
LAAIWGGCLVQVGELVMELEEDRWEFALTLVL